MGGLAQGGLPHVEGELCGLGKKALRRICIGLFPSTTWIELVLKDEIIT